MWTTSLGVPIALGVTFLYCHEVLPTIDCFYESLPGFPTYMGNVLGVGQIFMPAVPDGAQHRASYSKFLVSLMHPPTSAVAAEEWLIWAW